MRYLMLILFPPVGIYMFMTSEIGPPKKVRYFISFLSVIWMILIVAFLVNVAVNSHKKVDSVRESIFYDSEDDKIFNQVVECKKDEFDEKTDSEKYDYIKEIFQNVEGDYASLLFDDGTGIMFPGADLKQTASYGKMDNDGSITLQCGTVKLENNLYQCQMFSNAEIAQERFCNELSGEYSNDSLEFTFDDKDGDLRFKAKMISLAYEQESADAIKKTAINCGAKSGNIVFIDDKGNIVLSCSW